MVSRAQIVKIREDVRSAFYLSDADDMQRTATARVALLLDELGPRDRALTSAQCIADGICHESLAKYQQNPSAYRGQVDLPQAMRGLPCNPQHWTKEQLGHRIVLLACVCFTVIVTACALNQR